MTSSSYTIDSGSYSLYTLFKEWHYHQHNTLSATQKGHWVTDNHEFPPLIALPGSEAHLILQQTEVNQGEGRGAIYHHDASGLAYVWVNEDQSIFCHATARNRRALQTLVDALRTEFPEAVIDDDLVLCTLTFNTDHGARTWTKRLKAPRWDTVQDNYSASVRTQLSDLIGGLPADGGRLLLWQGPPGTGKTYAIRALMQAWKQKAQFSYIVDPEQFFGGKSDYMVQTIMDAAGSQPLSKYTSDLPSPPIADERMLVLVMEDCGELLAADAKDRVGQGLSRLLNLVDGIIGQGLNIMLLITTNEEITSFHPAVTRAGRCVDAIEFQPLTPEEATKWLNARGYTEPTNTHERLSELYRRINDWKENTFEPPREAPQDLFA